jgi:CHAT domain-containing protein/tetratricopeptide (TPR) repeat protein
MLRWLAGSALLFFLAAGIALSRMPTAPSRAAGPPEPPARPASENRAAQAARAARAVLEEATRVHGAESTQAADAMDALVCATMATGNRGDLPDARNWARESVRIRERTCGGGCLELANSLTHYEAVLWHLEDYRAALPIAERALAIRTRLLPPQDPRIGHSLYLLAEARRALGEFAVAEKLHRQAIAIWQLQPEDNAPHIAASLHYIGLMRWVLGDLVNARELIEQALSLRQIAEGPESQMVANDLNILGRLAVAMGDHEIAMSLFDRAQRAWERTLGKDDPQVARTLTNKAWLVAAAGDDAGAKVLLQRALRIRVTAFGGDHYLAARSLADLARLARDTGDYTESEGLFARALEVQQRDPQARGPELAGTFNDVAILALLTRNPARAIQLALRAEDIARGYFLRSSQGLDEVDALRYETVRSTGLDVALTALVRAPEIPDGPSRVWGELIQSRAIVLDRMAALHRTAPAGSPVSPTLSKLAEHLPRDSALVAFARFTRPGERREAPSASYLAFVLQPGGAPPAVLPLGSATEIETLVQDWRKEAGTDPRLDQAQDDEKRYRETAGRLRKSIWDPLSPQLQGRRIVFVVPDGALNLVSIAALPGKDGRYLIETEPSIHYLSAEKDIAALHGAGTSGRGMLALGGADFDAPPSTPEKPDTTFKSAAPACLGFEAMGFDPLPGTRREVEDIASLWGSKGEVLKLTGSDASEGAFKRLAPGKRILHLATHGFFLLDRCRSSLDGVSTADGEMAIGEDPLLLSGLALAAANRRAEISTGQEDGILTSEEIGALDLTGVEWTVLSGCETAIGQVLTGEGVLGLRRAFQVAGVGTLIMSLWPVDDGAARVWMHNLYQGRVSGLSTVEAANQASRRMLAAQRSSGRSTHPYFWGAFVAAGDWR